MLDNQLRPTIHNAYLTHINVNASCSLLDIKCQRPYQVAVNVVGFGEEHFVQHVLYLLGNFVKVIKLASSILHLVEVPLLLRHLRVAARISFIRRHGFYF